MTTRAAFSKSQLSVLLLAVAAVGLSVALIPRGRELALLRIESGDPRAAVAALEQQVADGDHSPATIGALARALAKAGDPAGASQVLERLVTERPGDRAALEALADVQRAAKRNDGLLHTLQALQALAPKTEWQRELARLMVDAGRPADGLRAMQILIQKFAAEPVDFVTLARLQQAAGDPAAGAATLQDLATRHPKAVDGSVVALQLRMLVAAGDSPKALDRARQWLANRRDLPRVAPMLAGAFSVAGSPNLAVTLLEPYAGPDADADLVAALAQAESDAGRPQDGLLRLERLGDTRRAMGTEAAALLRLQLALVVADTDRAMAAATILGLGGLPSDLLGRLATVPLQAGRSDALRVILAAAPPRFLDSDPALAARIQLALGDLDAARRWNELAARTVAGRPDQAINVAEVAVRLGQNDLARDLLRRAVAEPELPGASLRDIARLYIQSGQAAEGAAALNELRRSRHAKEADGAWALAATAAGESGDVGAWLSARGAGEVPPDLLRDIVYLANDNAARTLAVAAAERLFQVRHGADEGLLLARTLQGDAQARRALDVLRALPPGTDVPDDLNRAVLLAAWHQGAPVADELRAIWLRRLAEATAPQDRDGAIYVLLELHDTVDLLPVLRRLADQDPAHWGWTYSDAATAAGRAGELPAFWTTIALRPSLPPAFRRQLGFRVLEVGDKQRAEQVFRALASGAPARNPDVRQLLFIWGPRPSAEQLDWIEARARAATGADLAEWMQDLTDRRAPARAVAAYRAAERTAPSEALSDAYAAALEGVGDWQALAIVVRQLLPQAESKARMERYAYYAERAGATDLQRQALERLAASGGGPDAERRLGALAFRQRNMSEAERHLSVFVAATGGDCESYMLLGNIASRKRDPDGARRDYAEGLRLMQASNDRSFHARGVEAFLLHRLGRDDEAARLYQALLAERPGDENLRADFAAMLIEQGASRRAREVIARQ